MDLHSLSFAVSNLGPKSYQKAINHFGGVKEAFEGSHDEFEKIGITGLTFKKFDKFRKEFDPVRYTGQMKKTNVGFVSFLDKNYPKNLKKLENPPIGLFYKGNLKLLNSKNLKIAVVGTRKATNYGREVTEFLVKELADNETLIISGLALGVDGISHRVTIENKGLTIAVLACGVDCCLPSENFSLYSNILKNDGMIISEYPLSQAPNKGTFLARNRIIAALSDGVLITEAAEGSGSLTTAENGLKLNKKVFAVPGPINSQMAKGSISLLKKGAKLVSNSTDILEEFGKNIKGTKNIMKLNLSDDEKKVVKILENEDLGIDEILKRTNINISLLFSIITNLELKGIIKNNGGKISLAFYA